MINPKLVTCSLCENYYADPRQIPCSHSFCFDCISGRLDEENLTLTCPKCDKRHQYTSLTEFQQRCMRDGFLSSLVAKFKKNRSRSSAVSSSLASRPPSSASVTAPLTSSTPITISIPSVQTNLNTTRSLDQSDSERSTPSFLHRTTPPFASSQQETSTLTAKCQSCNTRALLSICNHCDNVICLKCRTEHQSSAGFEVQHQWDLCKNRYQTIEKDSFSFHQEQEIVIEHSRNLQSLISKQSEKWIQALENQKHIYIDQIEQHRQSCKSDCVQEQIIDIYEFIDKSIEQLLVSNDVDAEKVNDFLFEIDNFEQKIDDFNKLLDKTELKFPHLTLAEGVDISSLFGSLEFGQMKSNLNLTNPYLLASSESINDSHFSATKSEDDLDDDLPNVGKGKTILPENHFSMPISLTTIPTTPKKKLLWQIDYYSVPHYVRTYGNQLFVCDKYGSLAIYKFLKQDDKRQKPTKQNEVNLFKERQPASLTDEDQTIIDSFAVYKLWIVVFKRRKNELHGTIYLFSHDGKSIPNGKFQHNYPSRELTIDIEMNRLWSLDQKQLCLFYYDLPETKVANPDEYLQHRHSHVQFSKPFAPLHISVNKNVLAVLDKNRQAVHVYDKKSKQQLYEHVNIHRTTTHVCWDMALFSDNSLLIKLDETSSLKPGPSKHIYLQLDSINQHKIIGTIEETDAYGMMITPNDEIFIGIRINAKGIVKCYM